MTENLEGRAKLRRAVATISEKAEKVLGFSNFAIGLYVGFCQTQGHDTATGEVLKYTIPLGGMLAAASTFGKAKTFANVGDSVTHSTTNNRAWLIIPGSVVHAVHPGIGYVGGYVIGYILNR